MVTVQHLEKLYHIQRVFAGSNTLEATVANERIAVLIDRTEKLIKQRTFLREERRKLRMEVDVVEDYKRALSIMTRDDWIPQELKEDPFKDRIKINIGGLMFECTSEILIRDKGSILCQLVENEKIKEGETAPKLDSKSKYKKDLDGNFYYFDRDWWLFRYILIFLRDGRLPEDRNLLAQLYKEANFWNLKQLQKAIEDQRLHLGTATIDDPNIWWKKEPNYWKALDEAKKNEQLNEAKKNANKDWWLDNTYKGKTFSTQNENTLDFKVDVLSNLSTPFSTTSSINK